ncbi:MAG: hypothetical protein AAF564_03730 [Bacteroidota bacterium]
MKQFVFILFLAILSSGCAALHTPQSEVLLFEPNVADRNNGKGFSLNSSIVSRNMLAYAVDTHKHEGARDALAKRNYYGISFSYAHPMKLGAFGVALGSGGIGLDYTYAYADKVFMTLSGNAAQNVAAVLQMPIYKKEKSGLGVGIFYRNERHGLLENCREGYCLGINIGAHYRISAVGLQLAQYFDDDKGRLRIRFSLGYSPELRGIVVVGGLHTGYPR